ncbi:MAG TPA: cysteine--tRNA ligase [Firmicutes bacterium]|nr:cysteine--tRNA ligase [Candidatus Fermentithermobacillaceae bacterium]
MHPLYLFNTLTRKKEEFSPLEPGKVGMYTCGPTVYQYATIGNMRSYVFADILRRVLEYNGYSVKMVMNITDVGHLVSDADEGEDKMLVAVGREKKTPWEIAKFYTDAFMRDTARLNILRPSVVCYATEHIEEMLEMVVDLVEKGYGYETSDGIYFDISKFPSYGQLSGIKLEEQLAGARVEQNPEKRHPADFALWKKAPKEHIMQWPSPWGMGYPGWHIECSAMSRKYLGDQFDIHTGGVDHIPTHHENEIAQSQCVTGKIPARFWMHGEFLLVDGGKMSKSLGNTYTLDDLIARGFEPLAFRYFCFSAHYRSHLNFTWSALESAQKGLRSLRAAVQKAAREGEKPGAEEKVEAFRQAFLEAINDDLNMPRAVSVLWEAAKADLGRGLADLAGDFERVFALDLLTGPAADDRPLDISELPQEVVEILEERKLARQAKDWAKADLLREKLREMGYQVKDLKDGYEVTRIPR